HGVCIWLASYHDGSASGIVACRNDSVLGHDEHRARTLDTLINLVDAIHKGNDYFEMLDLNTGKCCFIVAALPQTNLFEKKGQIRIGTKYPHVARQYFLSKNMDVEIIKIDGSVELSPLIGLVDGIVDIMETGSTLKANGLEVLDVCARISARVIVNKASWKLKKAEITEVLADLKKAVDENA
ncbi:MAG: ATP phosphoribosyltransferase, partial [Allobaculum sp.]